MDAFVIIAQITTIMGWLLLVYSYYKDDIDELLFVQIISSIFYCISYFFLGAYSGLTVCFIELLKSVAYYKTDKDDLIFLLSIPFYIILAIFTYDGFLSLLPVIGSIIDGFVLTKNKTIATIGSILSNILWLIYDIILLAYVAALTDGVLVISNIIVLVFGYSRLLQTNKLRIVLSRGFSKKLYNTILTLDTNNYGKDNTWTYEYEKAINSKTNSLLEIRLNNAVIGYLSYFVINETEYLNIINSEKLIKEYNLNNVIEYQKHKKNYLIIDSINVKTGYQNSISTKLIVNKLRRLIQQKQHEGYKIESIVSPVFNSFEKNILETAGFTKYKEYDTKVSLYCIDKDIIDELYTRDIDNKDNYHVYFGNQIKESMLSEIRKLDTKFFDENYLWTEEYQKELFEKNKDTIIIVTYKNKVVGYLNYLVITKEKYDDMINSNKTIDNFSINEILPFYKSKKNYITINSVVIDKKHQDGYIIKYITKKLKKTLRKIHSNNYKIGAINSFAISEDGRNFLEKLGFERIKLLKDGSTLYVLEGKELKEYIS